MDEVVLLSGLSPQKVSGARMKGRKAEGRTLYPAAQVREFLGREGIRV
jgi:hypothetical protein